MDIKTLLICTSRYMDHLAKLSPEQRGCGIETVNASAFMVKCMLDIINAEESEKAQRAKITAALAELPTHQLLAIMQAATGDGKSDAGTGLLRAQEGTG